MAAVAHKIATPTTLGTTSYETGAFVPSIGDLLVALVSITGSVGGGSFSTDAGVTFTRVVTSEPGQAFSDSLEAFIANALITDATDISQTGTYTIGIAPTGAVVAVEAISGMQRTGQEALRQYDANAGSDTPFATFAAAALTGNPTIGLVAADTPNPLNITPPGGWTELFDTGYLSPTSGVEACARDSGFTGSTIIWGSAVANDYGCIILEFDASAPEGQSASKRSGGVPYMTGKLGPVKVWSPPSLMVPRLRSLIKPQLLKAA